MDYLLDNKKVYCILAGVFIIWLYCILSKSKHTPSQFIATPIKTKAVVGYQPRYFNTEIYSMPNAKASPHILYGSECPSNTTNTLGFERLLPQVDQLPVMSTISAYAIQEHQLS
jgi:hypothetical protein